MVCPDPQVGPKNGPLRPQSVGWSPRGFTSSGFSFLLFLVGLNTCLLPPPHKERLEEVWRRKKTPNPTMEKEGDQGKTKRRRSKNTAGGKDMVLGFLCDVNLCLLLPTF